MKVLVLSLLILLGACTTASISTPERCETPEGPCVPGATVEFTRVWSDVTFTLGPDGTMSYSSNADPNTALLQGFLNGSLRANP